MDVQPKAEPDILEPEEPPSPAISAELARSIVLVGLMGAGKTSVGRRLADLLGVRFVDSDERIVEAAGMSIPDIFEAYGEAEFRNVERRVIANLLDGDAAVIAYGGGAFINDETRRLTLRKAYSIWLRADIDTLVQRTSRKKGTRPLLDAGDPRAILSDLAARRGPLYAMADLVVDTGEQPAQQLAETILSILPADVIRRN